MSFHSNLPGRATGARYPPAPAAQAAQLPAYALSIDDLSPTLTTILFNLRSVDGIEPNAKLFALDAAVGAVAVNHIYVRCASDGAPSLPTVATHCSMDEESVLPGLK